MNAHEQQVIENPHSVQFQHWAAMWGMKHVFVTTLEDWKQALPDGDVVIEIIPDETHSEAFWTALTGTTFPTAKS
jgi:2-succinyl-5-enolpyruvyl-6-hydroxy-3-cyclohexene-1-carboxylate synthase